MRRILVPALMLATLLPLEASAQVFGAASPAAAGPRDPTGADVKGTGVIRGRVTSLETGRPLRRARISLNSPELGSPRTASTNTDGRYEIRDLPAGRYTLNVARSGYLSLSFGQRRPGEAGKPFELADKQVVDKIDFALPRMGLISGRVFDELGEPIAGVRVWAMQQLYFQGARRFVPTGGGPQGTTDDTGQYRLLALAPGSYVVMAQSRETWPLDDDPKQIFSYAPSYYPGTSSGTDAQRVKVGTGQEVTGIDFALSPVRTAKISGTVLTASGVPLGGESVSVSQEIRGPTMSSVSSVSSSKTNGDGTFTLNNVAPGDYQLNVRVAARSDQPALQGMLPLSVSGADIEGVTIVAGAGGSVRGQVVTDDGGVLPSNIDRMTVRAQAQTPGMGMMGAPTPDNGRVSKEGTFEVAGLFGPSMLSIGPLTGDWALKAIEVESRDLADEPIDVSHGDTVSGVRVVLTNRPTIVRGGLTDEKRQPAEGTIVVFAEDSSRWRDGSRVIRAARPDQNGEFSVKGLPAGSYLIAAVDFVQDGQWNDPEFLEGLKPRAERIVLAEAESKRIDLTMRK